MYILFYFIFVLSFLFFHSRRRPYPPEKYQPSELHDQRNSLNEVPAANPGGLYIIIVNPSENCAESNRRDQSITSG